MSAALLMAFLFWGKRVDPERFDRLIGSLWSFRRAILIASIGGSAEYAYVSSVNLWPWVSEPTAWCVSVLLDILHIDAFYFMRGGLPEIIVPTGKYVIFWGCSGFEGVALMIFILSCIFLVDYDRFVKFRLWKWYSASILSMLVINIVRIASIIWYTRTPINLFHSNCGWIFYSIDVTIFLGVMYLAGNNKQTRN